MRTVRAYAMEDAEVERYQAAGALAGAAHRWLGVHIGVFQGEQSTDEALCRWRADVLAARTPSGDCLLAPQA